ncbi:E3 ubiquitin-protein ligase E3D [Spiromyces aspiralis]|uniref:E3 ubiquitin-protein ligase E3D n=1 Tax=Spiromyces aspiralis TaxID=68401 RepID=A0ACC1HSL7_9FUNG|nr:E3 ubiquitin-protein ligase E3D [Spiromyces aspiralis]
MGPVEHGGSFSVFMETLPNIGTLDTYISFPQTSGPEEPPGLNESTSWHDVVVTESQISYGSDASKIVLPLPIRIDPSRLSITSKPGVNGTLIRLQSPLKPDQSVEASGRESGDIVPERVVPLPRAKDLAALHSIRCALCKGQITVPTTSSGGERWQPQDLPSEYWEEMVDCWVCHPEQDRLAVDISQLRINPKDATSYAAHQERVQKETPNSISTSDARRFNIKVGHNYVLLHSAVVDTTSVVTHKVSIDNKDRFHDYYLEVLCGRCHSSLGEVDYLPNAFSSGLHPWYKLNHCKIEFANGPLRDDDSEESSIAPTLSQHLAAEMLEHVSAHASHRFIIEDRKTCIPRIMIWLWSSTPTTVASNLLQSDDATFWMAFGSRSHRALKVFYKILLSGSSDSDDLDR